MQPALMENLQLALRPPPVLPVDPCSLAVGFLPRRRRIPPPSAPRRRRRRPCPPSPPLNSTSKFSVPFCFCPVKTQPAG